MPLDPLPAELPPHENHRQRFALLGVLLVGAGIFTAQSASAGEDGFGNTTAALMVGYQPIGSDSVHNLGVSAFPPLPSDAPCTRPDGGLSFTCYCPPGTRLRIGGNTASLSYRSTLDPDAGFAAGSSDNPCPAGALCNGTLVASPLGDGGGFVSVLLSVADSSAGVSSAMGGGQLCQ